LAWAFIKYSSDYTSQPPWEYRAQAMGDSGADHAGEFPIKGNINAKGEKIYHALWSKHYAATKIDTSKGERWFCSEAEAKAAGWRAAYR